MAPVDSLVVLLVSLLIGGLGIETLLFMVLDVTAKVGFGFILLRSRAILGDTEAPEPSAGAEASAAD